MKTLRIIALGLAMAVFILNFWTIDYDNLTSESSLWAFGRIVAALALVIFTARMVKKDRQNKVLAN